MVQIACFLLLLAIISGVSSFSAITPSISSSGKDEKIGIAIAGGGTRAISTAHGILRGLQQQQITRGGKDVPALDGVDAMSGVSGGSWTASIYAFAKAPSNTLLDVERTTDPKAITANDLTTQKPDTMGNAIPKFTHTRLLFWALIYGIFLSFGKIYRGWTMMCYRSFFKPLGTPKNKFFTSSKEAVAKIVSANKGMKAEDFIVPREEVKAVPIANFAMLAPQKVDIDFQKVAAKFEAESIGSGHQFLKPENVLKARQNNGGVTYAPFVASPDAVGSPYGLDISNTMTINDSLAIQFPVPSAEPWAWGPNNEERFSIELAAAMSSSYPQVIVLNKIKGRSKKGPLSRIRRWIGLKIDERFTQKYNVNVGGNGRESIMFVDGGLTDTTGVCTLVHRKVPKIFFIMNVSNGDVGNKSCYMEFHKETAQSTNYEIWLKGFCPSLTSLFGYAGSADEDNENASILSLNHVYDDGEARLKELMEGMGKLTDAGHPLIYTLKGLNVIDNTYWNTVKGNKVDLTIYFANLPKNFAKEISIETAPPPPGKDILDANGRFTNEKLKEVPEVSVMGVSAEEVNMMGYLGSWAVKESWGGLRAQDGSIVFEGFEDFFTV